MLKRLVQWSLLLPKHNLGCIKPNKIRYYPVRFVIMSTEPWPCEKKRKLEDDSEDFENKKRERRKMHAILLAYNGQGYSGLQRNIGSKTIEEELLVALKKINVISETEFKKQQLVNFQRAARTDKGVSALRQVVNLLMRDGVVPDDLNPHLPPQVKVLAVKRVTKGFNSKNTCDHRTYSYTCPTFAFAPKGVTPSEDYRIDEKVLQNLTEWAENYKGTHNYYNYTSGRKPHDPSCKRNIIFIEMTKPIIRDGLELMTILIKGQSFMLHQIRKMVGTLITIARGYLKPDIIMKSFDSDKNLHLPVAPGAGLLLEQVHYDWYNRKYANNGFHGSLDFKEVEDQVEEFREKFIYPMLINIEKEEKSMLSYMQTIDEQAEFIEQSIPGTWSIVYNNKQSLNGNAGDIDVSETTNQNEVEEELKSNISNVTEECGDSFSNNELKKEEKEDHSSDQRRVVDSM